MWGKVVISLVVVIGMPVGAGVEGAEISLVPMSSSGPHTTVGNEIVLHGGGQRVFLEIFIDEWDPDLDGDPSLKVWETTVDSTGYSSGTSGTIGPASQACVTDSDCVAAFGTGSVCADAGGTKCTAGFINENRADYIFVDLLSIPVVDATTLDYKFGDILLFPPYASDPGTPRHAGNLVLDVPPGAVGTFTVGFKGGLDSFLMDGSLVSITPLALTAARITVGPMIPAASEWGLVVMSLLVLTAGTLVCARRRVVQG